MRPLRFPGTAEGAVDNPTTESTRFLILRRLYYLVISGYFWLEAKILVYRLFVGQNTDNFTVRCRCMEAVIKAYAAS